MCLCLLNCTVRATPLNPSTPPLSTISSPHTEQFSPQHRFCFPPLPRRRKKAAYHNRPRISPYHNCFTAVLRSALPHSSFFDFLNKRTSFARLSVPVSSFFSSSHTTPILLFSPRTLPLLFRHTRTGLLAFLFHCFIDCFRHSSFKLQSFNQSSQSCTRKYHFPAATSTIPPHQPNHHFSFSTASCLLHPFVSHILFVLLPTFVQLLSSISQKKKPSTLSFFLTPFLAPTPALSNKPSAFIHLHPASIPSHIHSFIPSFILSPSTTRHSIHIPHLPALPTPIAFLFPA